MRHKIRKAIHHTHHHLRRVHHVIKHFHPKGYHRLSKNLILLFLIIFFIIITGSISVYQYWFKPQASGSNVGRCRDNPVSPPAGYYWRADCSERGKCRQNSDCPKNTTDSRVNPETSNWCYGFEGDKGSWEDWRCLKLEYIGEGRQGSVFPTLTNIPIPTLSITLTPTTIPSITPSPTATKTPTPSPTKTPTPTSTPTLTPTITLTPTPTIITDVNLQIKLRFQGVNKRPKKEFNQLKVKINLISDQKSINLVKESIFVANESGIWTGQTGFNGVALDGVYRILVKGEKHLQKKVCDLRPREAIFGNYSCQTERITLNRGNNELDFSGIILLVGDIPPQDGVLNSYDSSFIFNNIGKKDSEILRKGDLDLDGVISARDYSLIIEVLKMGKIEDEK